MLNKKQYKKLAELFTYQEELTETKNLIASLENIQNDSFTVEDIQALSRFMNKGVFQDNFSIKDELENLAFDKEFQTNKVTETITDLKKLDIDIESIEKELLPKEISFSC